MEIGIDAMASMRAQVCACPVAARGGPAVVAELATLLRVAIVPPMPTAGDLRCAAVNLDLPDAAVARRVSRLASALGVPMRGIRHVGAVPRRGGRSTVTGSTIRPGRWVRLRVQLGPVTARLGLFAGEGRLVPGLPPAVLVGGRAVAAAGWRAALLARGEWAPQMCPPVLGLACPTDDLAADLAVLAHVLRVQVVVRTLDRGSLLRVGAEQGPEAHRDADGRSDPADAAAAGPGGTGTGGGSGSDDTGTVDDIGRLIAVVGAAARPGAALRPGLAD